RLKFIDHTKAEWNSSRVKLINPSINSSRSDSDLDDLLALFRVQIGSQNIHCSDAGFEFFEIFTIYFVAYDVPVINDTRASRQLDQLLGFVQRNIASATRGNIYLCQ